MEGLNPMNPSAPQPLFREGENNTRPFGFQGFPNNPLFVFDFSGFGGFWGLGGLPGFPVLAFSGSSRWYFIAGHIFLLLHDGAERAITSIKIAGRYFIDYFLKPAKINENVSVSVTGFVNRLLEILV